MSFLLFFCKNSKAITVHMLACKKRIIDAELFGQKDFLMNSGKLWERMVGVTANNILKKEKHDWFAGNVMHTQRL